MTDDTQIDAPRTPCDAATGVGTDAATGVGTDVATGVGTDAATGAGRTLHADRTPRDAGTDAGTEAWHRDLPETAAPSGGGEHRHGDQPSRRPLHHVRAGALDADTAQTKGMRRFEALSRRHGGAEKIWLGENHVGPEMKSGDHHHGEAETGIYVVSGHPEFVFLADGEEQRIRTRPGDYVFVPPYVPHREENPNDVPAVVVLARSTQEGIVVNLPSLDVEIAVPAAADAPANGRRPS